MLKMITASLIMCVSILSHAEAKPSELESICMRPALRAVNALAVSKVRWKVSSKIEKSSTASTKLIYDFYAVDISDSIFTVVADAYPADSKCVINSVTNNVAAND